jgi:hypothetical protein
MKTLSSTISTLNSALSISVLFASQAGFPNPSNKAHALFSDGRYETKTANKKSFSFHLNHTIWLPIWALLLFFSSSTFASITYLSDNRQDMSAGDEGDGTGYYQNIYAPDTPFAFFAHQNSSLTSTGFSAQGSGHQYSDYGYSLSESVFDITFNLASQNRINLTSTLGGSGENPPSALIYLYSGVDKDTDNLLFSSSLSYSDTEYPGAYSYSSSPTLDTILTAGNYRIIAKADGGSYVESNSNYSVNAEFTTVVPTPPAFWLLGLGLFSLVNVRKRKA